jgi:hypothetical protein
MPEADEPDPLNLSGQWQGFYSYPSRQRPVSFSASLTESGSWLTGTTTEKGSQGATRGRVLDATLQGRRTGRSVTFLKLYADGFPTYDGVHYEGEVREDGTEIEGRWSIPGNWSGKFLMIRAGGHAAEQRQKAAERIGSR